MESNTNNSPVVIEMKGIHKNYYEGKENELHILKNIDLVIHDGEFVSIVGESGSGKSTMMNIMGALDRPSKGTYFLAGEDVSRMNDEQLSEIRNEEIGFVFQNACMIPRITALENVEVPMMYGGVSRKERRERAMELLDQMGMADRCDHQANELSGGQNQRVAIARALANDPSIILADEPTGALDSVTGHMIMDIFHKLNADGKTIVLITHSKELALETRRIVTIADGRILSDEENLDYEKIRQAAAEKLAEEIPEQNAERSPDANVNVDAREEEVEA